MRGTYGETGLLLSYSQGLGFTNHRPRMNCNGLLDDEGIDHQQRAYLPVFASSTSNMMRTSSIPDFYLGEDLFNTPQAIIEEEPQLEFDDRMTTAISMMTPDEDITSAEAMKVPDTPSISEYFLGDVDSLFKAQDPILEDPRLELDIVTATMSMMSSSEDIDIAETTTLADIASIDSEQLLNDFFYNCKDLHEQHGLKDSGFDQLDVKVQPFQEEGNRIIQNNVGAQEGSISKSASMDCLMLEEWAKCNGGSLNPNFLNFHEMDFGAAFGMRRAYSEGDIMTLGNGNLNPVNANITRHPMERILCMDSHRIEERQEKLSRYRRKKSMRNFGRKIKYACRKALADSQPRIRGRFARTEECEVQRLSK